MEREYLYSISRAVAGFSCEFEKIARNEQELLTCRDHLIEQWGSIAHRHRHNPQKNPLAVAANKLNDAFTVKQQSWMQAWDAQQTTKQFAENYEDRVVLLVFGKVNAGKSSLTNFIASTFAPSECRFFCLRDGKIETLSEPLKEGVIETTAQIQGVELGKSLVLLDSPGLYSVTDANGDLTRRFTDSADGVLWLTPSTSPGQVQELLDLQRELDKKKPILPVITRSDLVEEDIDENDEIIKVLINKSEADRQAQQQDVLTRAGKAIEELAGTEASKLLREPISVSVHAFKESSRTEMDFRESGLEELFIGIRALIEKAMGYKPLKARQQVINYLDTEILGGIKQELQKPLAEYAVKVEQEREETRADAKRLINSLLQDLGVFVPDWAEEAARNGRDKNGLIQKINGKVVGSVQAALTERAQNYLSGAKTAVADACNMDIGDFDDITIEYEQVSGSGLKAAAGAGGATAGALAGAAIAGPVGAFVGGLLGSFFGSKGGNYLISTETVTQSVGVDASALTHSILKQLQSTVPVLVSTSYQPLEDAISMSANMLADYIVAIKEFSNSLEKLKQGVNS